jgi:hypothetical protein
VVTLPTPRHATRIYSDALGFVYGPAEVSLYATGVGTPVASATERHLLSLLYGRAKAHKL